MKWIHMVAAVGLLVACGGSNGGGSADGGGTGMDGGLCGPGLSCGDGEVCRYGACVSTPAPCTLDEDCLGDFYCDEPQNECLPFGIGPTGSSDDGCARQVVPGVFFPGVQCEWLGPPPGDPFPDHKNVLSAPMVVDFGGGGDPELSRPSIVLVSYNFTDGGGQSCDGTDPAYFGVIRILDGRTCEQKDTLGSPTVVASSSVALADLNGDGRAEIIAPRNVGGLVAFSMDALGDWSVLWETASTLGDGTCDWGGISVHDLDDQLPPEVIHYGWVYDASGVALDEALAPTALDPLTVGYIPVVADVDLDGKPELVSGAQVYAWDLAATAWVPKGPAIGQSGRTAVADLGTFGADPGLDDRATLDGIAEIVTVNAGVIHAYSLTGRQVFTAGLMAGGGAVGSGGPPTIADFDGDGRAEMASAGATAYTVFDPDCVAGAAAAVCPSGRTDGVLWFQPSQDGSSNVTGSSVFDFEGDGRNEVVYADECYTRVYDGSSGQVMYSRFRTSCTWYENPVVADVDADFNAEIVIPSNQNCNVACPALDPIFDGVQCLDDSDCPGATSCGREQAADALGRCRCTADADCGGDGFVCRDPIAGVSAAGQVCRAAHGGQGVAFGIRVISDQLDRWVNTRRVWNQHAYSVTNTDEAGRIPRTSLWLPNWTQPGLNNFRANAPGDGLGGGLAKSPDLTVHAASFTCAGGGATFAIELCNRGTEPVADGLAFTVYAGKPPGAPVACTAVTTADIFPGQCIDTTCVWTTPGATPVDATVVVDDAGAGAGDNLECREANNQFVVSAVVCP